MVKISRPNVHEDVCVYTHKNVIKIAGDFFENMNYENGEISGAMDGGNPYKITEEGKRSVLS